MTIVDSITTSLSNVVNQYSESEDDKAMPSDRVRRGSIVMSDPNGNKYFVKDVLYVPNADKPILSVAKAIRQGLTPTFKPYGEFLLSARSNNFVLQGNTVDDILYVYEAQTPHITNAVTTRAQK